jgi:RNA polymerase sigma-70 factor (ECF subfamily)
MKHGCFEEAMSENEEIFMSAENLYASQIGMTVTPVVNSLRAPDRPTQYQTRPAAKISKSKESQMGLIERLKAGDESALETIFNLHSAKLYNVALRILGGDRSDAEEIIQDVFLTAFRRASMFQGNSQFSTWLYRLTVNAALGRIRRSKKHKAVEYEEFLPKFQKDGYHQARPVVDWSDSLDEACSHQETRALLAEALGQLKPVDKSVVVLSDVEDMSDKEIAETLNLTVSAVKTRLHRARLFLRGKLAVHFGHSAA